MGSIFGGGGGGGGGSSSGTQVQIAREAPEVESRKLALYDEAAALAKQPVSVPAYQVAGPTALEQTGFQQAGVTGIGAPTATAGIGSVLGAQQAAGQQLNIGQFMNPYQRFVTDEITRQAQIAQNQLAAQSVQAGAFGGGRQGIAQAEIERARQANIGQSLQQGFGQALGAAERERALQAQTGLQAGQQLGALGAQQQAMAQADIQSLLQAGGVQRQLGQQALEAQRQTSLAQQYEPYQRIEFLKNIMTNLPTTQSALTATTAPGANPLSQAAGAGLGAYAAYNIAKRKEGGLIEKKNPKKGGIKDILKFNEGGFSETEKSLLALQAASQFLQGTVKPGESKFGALLRTVGEAGEKTIPTAIKLAASKKKAGQKQTVALTHGQGGTVEALGLTGVVQPGDRGTIQVQNVNGRLVAVSNPTITSKSEDRMDKIRKSFEATKVGGSLAVVKEAEDAVAESLQATGEIAGVGPVTNILPTQVLSDRGKNIRNIHTRMMNITLKDRSGAAVTDPELNRLKEELNATFGKSDKDYAIALRNMRNYLNTRTDLATAGFDDSDLNMFYEKGGEGYAPRKSPLEGFISGKGATIQKQIQYKKDAPMYIMEGGKLKLKTSEGK